MSRMSIDNLVRGEKSITGSHWAGWREWWREYLWLLVPVVAASDLDGGLIAAAEDVGEVRVLAVTTDGGRQTVWGPPASYVLCEGDLLIVVATRLGLGNLLAQTGGTVDPTP